MINKILIPVRGSLFDESIIKYAAELFPKAEFHLVTVIDTYSSGIQLTALLYDEMKTGAVEVLEFVRNILKNEGISEPVTSILEGTAYKKIIEYAIQNDIDIIVIARYKDKRGMLTPQLSNTLRNVLLHSNIPVIMIPSECKCAQLNKIILFTEGSKISKLAENFALLFVSTYKLNLHVMFIKSLNNKDITLNDISKNLKWKSSHLGIKVKILNDIGNSITKMRDEALNYNIAIMGVGKKRLFWSILSEQSNMMATKSPIPVIFVRSLQKRWSKRI